MEKINNIPEKLKKITPVSLVEQCMDIANKVLIKSSDSEVNYKVFLAKNYFKENLELFTPSEVSKIMSNKLFKNNLNGDFPQRALEYSLNNMFIFPSVFNEWFSKSSSFNSQVEYLKLINTAENREQIAFFLKKDSSLAYNLLRDKNFSSSNVFIEEAQKADIENILFNKTWSEEKLCLWLNDNLQHIEKIANVLINTETRNLRVPVKTNISFEVKNSIYKTLSKFLINPENQKNDNFIYYLKELSGQFWNEVESLSPGLIKDSMKVLIEVDRFKLNLLQSIVESIAKNVNKLNKFIDLMKPYEDLLLSPVIENLGTYEKECHVFETALREKNWALLISHDIGKLNNSEKEMMMAGAFLYLHEVSVDSGKKIYDQWALTTCMNMDLDIFEKYYNKNKNTFPDKISIEDNQLIKELDHILLSKKIENNLPEKNTIATKIKI